MFPNLAAPGKQVSGRLFWSIVTSASSSSCRRCPKQKELLMITLPAHFTCCTWIWSLHRSKLASKGTMFYPQMDLICFCRKCLFTGADTAPMRANEGLITALYIDSSASVFRIFSKGCFWKLHCAKASRIVGAGGRCPVLPFSKLNKILFWILWSRKYFFR